MTDIADEMTAELDALLVARYLEQHPEFFVEHHELLLAMKLPHAQRGSVSLVERQQELLREQNQQLREEITALMTVAQHNEDVYRAFCGFFLSLLDCRAPLQLKQAMQRHLQQPLKLSAINLLPSNAQQSDPFDRRLPLDRQALANLVKERVREDSPYYFGRLNQQDQSLLFEGEQAASVALVLLDGQLGVLAFGSAQPDHFNPQLDVLLLGQLRLLIGNVLNRMAKR